MENAYICASRTKKGESEAAGRRVATAAVLAVAPHRVSLDTIEALECLLADARSGDVVGLAVAAVRQQQQFVTAATGAAYLNPAYARGMVAALDDHLREVMEA